MSGDSDSIVAESLHELKVPSQSLVFGDSKDSCVPVSRLCLVASRRLGLQGSQPALSRTEVRGRPAVLGTGHRVTTLLGVLSCSRGTL